jgi:poly-gamma-glutamate synthesis protein (capsule biosynthesis protein)
MPQEDFPMRNIIVLSFIALSGGALVMKEWKAPRPHFELRELASYMPDFSSVSQAATPPVFEPITVTVSTPLPVLGERQLTIVLAGDTGLNGSFQPVHARFGTKHGRQMAWNEATPGIAGLIDGDINFANLETVVTDRNDLPASLKLFGFRTHPDGVRHLMRLGFNVFSTANNHAMDYGPEGAHETLLHLDAAGVAHAGLGLTRAAARAPRVIERRGVRVAFGALGIGGNGYGSLEADERRPGQLSPNSTRDMSDAATALWSSGADYKVLSVHYGAEFEPTTSEGDRARFRRALDEGADMVVGHHAHVAAGVELVNGKPVFYGLGNFLHWGTQDMSRHDMCHDYGLVARVHLGGLPGEHLAVRAIEAVPLTGMHKAPREMSAEEAGARVQAINYLARQFGANGVRFAVLADGRGLYCGPGAARLTGTVGELCRAGVTVSEPAPALHDKIEAACANRVVRIVEKDEGAFEQVSFVEP